MAQREPLDRRRISKALQTEYGWLVRTTVDGSVFVRPKRGIAQAAFIAEVRAAVERLNYTPDVKWWTDSASARWVRVQTPETLSQAGRGAHNV
jgi:hypothetical protein